MFHIKEETKDNRITFLQFNSDNFEIIEEKFDEADAEYMLLTESLGWKKGLNKISDLTLDDNINVLTKLAKYLFLNE